MSDAAHREKASPALIPYLILGFCLLLLALAARAPASLLQRALPASLPMQVTAWGGSVWQGQAALAQGESRLFAEWQVQPLSLLAGRLATTLDLRGALQVTGKLRLGLGSWRVEGLQGELPTTFVQSFLPGGWQLPGSIQADNLVVARRGFRQGAWQAGSGQLHWGGGAMQFSVNGQPQSALLPPLVVNVQQEGDALVLALNESAGGLATVRLTADGQLETQLRERLLRYSPAYRGSGADPDAVVVTTRQAL